MFFPIAILQYLMADQERALRKMDQAHVDGLRISVEFAKEAASRSKAITDYIVYVENLPSDITWQVKMKTLKSSNTLLTHLWFCHSRRASRISAEKLGEFFTLMSLMMVKRSTV